MLLLCKLFVQIIFKNILKALSLLFLASRAAFLSLKIPPVTNKGRVNSSKLPLLVPLRCQTMNFSSLSLCKSLISQHHFLLDLLSLNVPPSPPTLILIKLTNSSSLFTKKIETPKFAELPKWVSFGKNRIKTENYTSLYPRELYCIITGMKGEKVLSLTAPKQLESFCLPKWDTGECVNSILSVWLSPLHSEMQVLCWF